MWTTFGWRGKKANRRRPSSPASYLGEREHVEVVHVVLVGAFDPLLALLRVDHLSHVLGHKVALEERTSDAPFQNDLQ